MSATQVRLTLEERMYLQLVAEALDLPISGAIRYVIDEAIAGEDAEMRTMLRMAGTGRVTVEGFSSEWAERHRREADEFQEALRRRVEEREEHERAMRELEHQGDES